MPTVTSKNYNTWFIDSTYFRSDVGDLTLQKASGQYAYSRLDKRVTNSNPNWRQVIARGGNAATPYERSSVLKSKAMRIAGSSFTPPGNLVVGTRHYGRGSSRQQLLLDPSQFHYAAEDTDLRDQALARLKRKMSKHAGQKNLAVPLVELRELRGLIRGTAELTMRLVLDLLLIKRTRGKSAFSYASDAWLTWSFGVAPMLSDTEEIIEAIGTYLDKNDHSARLTGTASSVWKQTASAKGVNGIFNAPLSWHADIIHELSYRYIAGFDFNLSSANNYGIMEQFGLRLGSLPSVLWELTPYSWVFDYFTTIGAYLEDTFETDPSVTRYVVLDRYYTCNAQILGSYVANKGTVVTQQNCKPGMHSYRSLIRTTSATLPTRALRFKSVDEIGKNAVNKLLNLTSLLAPSSRKVLKWT